MKPIKITEKGRVWILIFMLSTINAVFCISWIITSDFLEALMYVIETIVWLMLVPALILTIYNYAVTAVKL
jgi:hypothetical protein